jgi:hypothetical protein
LLFIFRSFTPLLRTTWSPRASLISRFASAGPINLGQVSGHGAPNRILTEQTYPGSEDNRKHFIALRDAFLDQRYLRINGCPIFVIFRPRGLLTASVVAVTHGLCTRFSLLPRSWWNDFAKARPG